MMSKVLLLRKHIYALIATALFLCAVCCVLFVAVKTSDGGNARAEGEHEYTDHGTAVAAGMTLTDGNYYLADDVIGSITVSGEVNLCLNGHTLSASDGSVIRIESGTLNLYDCSGDNSGVVTGGSADNGGGILVEGNVMNMYGGTVTGNSSTGDGGGVNVSHNGRFAMYGGVISSNTAQGKGGGVYICNYGGTSAAFIMHGGKIVDNGASVGGGGVHINDAGDSFAMYGGEVSGNTAVNGGVYIATGVTASIAGDVKIKDNKLPSGSACNLYLESGSFAVSGALEVSGKEAAIGVTFGSGYSGDVFATGYNANNAGKDPSVYFSFDADSNRICSVNDSGGLEFLSLVNITLSTVDMIWRNGSADLISGPVFEYTGGGEPIYSKKQLNPIPSGYTEVEKLAVNSVVYHTGSAVTLEFNGPDRTHYTVDYDVASYDANVQVYCGKYVTAVELTAERGYVFALGGNAVNDSYGVGVEISDNGKTARIVKTWYIIDEGAMEGVNAFLFAEGGTYGVEDFIFGVAEAQFPIEMPRLRYGDDGADWIDNDFLVFTLSSVDGNGNTVVGSITFRRNTFSDYINNSMPAGVYRMTVAVGEINVTAGTTPWWTNDPIVNSVTCPSLIMTYNFTVTSAPITLDIESDETYGYLDYSWEIYEGRDVVSFFDGFENKLKNSPPTFVTVERKGYWAGANWNDRYYGGTYSLTYNFARMYDSRYYSPNEIRAYIRGGNSGTYKVFFRITAPNHGDFASGADRYAYFFTVTVFEKVATPTVADTVFTNAKALPVIASNPYYSVEWDADDEYISGGTHYVTFELADSEHYRWADENAATGENKNTLRVAFEITAADNGWVQVPYIVGWEHGSYGADANKIISLPKYGADKVYYTVATDAEFTSPCAGLEKFAADDETALAALSKLEADTYYIKGAVDASRDYKKAESAPVPFRVTKAVNYWLAAPTVSGWVEGEYDEKNNAVTALSKNGSETVVIIIRDADGKEYYNSATGFNDLAKASVGDYILTATVAETSSYSGLETAVAFRIFEGSGMPWWIILIIVLGILLIVFIVFLILYKKGVLQLVTEKMVVAIRTRADSDATIAAVRAGKIAAESERARMSEELAAAARAAAIAEEDEASDAEEALPEEEETEEAAVYEPEADDKEIQSSKGFVKVFAANSSASYNYGKTVLSKLITSPDNVKARYSELKNYLLAYKKARANMSRARESFYLGRRCYARIAVRGKTLCMYIAADPGKYADTKYNVEDVSGVKMYTDTPCMFRIRSDRALRYAKELVDELMLGLNAVMTERKPENYAELFKSIEKLEKKNLLSYNGKKRRGNGGFNSNDSNKGE